MLEDPTYEVGAFQVRLHVTPDLLEESPEHIQAGFRDFPVFFREWFKLRARNRKQASSDDDQ